MEFEDKTIACVDCGESFIFSTDEQQRYAERGFAHEPKRCPQCRAKRRSQGGGRPKAGQQAESYNRGGSAEAGDGGYRRPSHGHGGGRGPARSADSRRPQREQFQAVCSECGELTTVPFKPVEGRPVFCRECYRSKRA